SLVPLDDVVRDIFLLGAPIHDPTTVKLKVVSSSIYGGTYIAHLTPSHILPLWNTSWSGNWPRPEHETPDTELLYPPDGPFYVSTLNTALAADNVFSKLGLGILSHE
ncbi:hypothetical protein COL922a_014944, partial [Colletotrichum nupharicola]